MRVFGNIEFKGILVILSEGSDVIWDFEGNSVIYVVKGILVILRSEGNFAISDIVIIYVIWMEDNLVIDDMRIIW